MQTTKPLLSLFGVLTACLALAGCDEKDDEMTGTRDSSADEGDDEESAEEEGEGEGESGGGEMSGAMTAGTGATGGEVVIPPECQALCECIGMIGGDPNSCGMACGGAIVDDDPADRDQCLTYLSMAMYTECNAECETFGGGG